MHTLTGLLLSLDWGLTGWTVLLATGELLAALTIPSVLLARRGQPLSALAWVFGLVGLPFAGVVTWWAIGRSHLVRKRRRRQHAHSRFAAARAREWGKQPCVESQSLPLRELAHTEGDGMYPTVPGNRLLWLLDGGQTYRALERAVAAATHHIHFLFYSWAADRVGARFRDLLAEKARDGIEVRVLCDALGSAAAVGRFMDPLRRAGARVEPFMPTRYLRRSLTVNFRNHRKIAVVDGRLAYTGGLNLGEEYLHDWRDLGLLVEGPVVAHLQEVFADDWYFTTSENLAKDVYFAAEARAPSGVLLGEDALTAPCALLAGGPDLDQPLIHDAVFLVVTRAMERVWLATPYLIPTAPIQAALRTAVLRGVDVRLLVPRRSDLRLTQLAGRSYYPTLLASGVRIFEFLPAILHEKLWIVDHDLALVGSANLDIRSFKLNFETACVIHGREPNDQLARLLEAGFAESEEVTLDALERRGHLTNLAEAALNLVSPLL